jgi:hypothetical protein
MQWQSLATRHGDSLDLQGVSNVKNLAVDRLAGQAIIIGFFGVRQFGPEAGQQHEGNVDKALTNRIRPV